ncbi:thioredoxin-disulfide reductase [Citromicrobium bathyomarinum]|uniref:thioredoxin-disulfide reductase n=1 Tax=Citromicrobium TaxID=72173 RepID=UPI0001DD0BC6|nr:MULTISPECIES: thioredoxin-disulfide reductase [Citromicrobium]MEC8179137.1 thioredoxin-disulfide reductase [Pseudomonadota bacterium]ALG61427.1 thioredoxin reductase [Citromicrobium sp. JL477]KPM14378.1 thioredoxin reductase [Citromicrobium sp. JL1351]KPM20859.1 thioredoxin reductase [Citromicrobium sp. JL31]KPM26844.1 thioredoxin reductase [Citromicrobium sp. JL2201]
MATHRTKMLIIGSGPAGYSAAIYGARAMLQPIMVQGLQPGGQLTITTDVENYPGFADVIQGPWLMEQMRAQAEHVGTQMIWDTIVEIDLKSGPPFRAKGDSGDEYIASTVVIATGASAKWLGVPGEQELGGKGVSACATCDGFFYRGKKVAVIGGGNTAVEEALYLTNHSDDVTLIHRRDELRAEKILQERLFASDKITPLWNKAVERFEAGENGALDHLVLKDTVTGEESTLEVDGAFVAIGHAPATELFQGQLPLEDGGYLKVEPGTPKTEIPGVFACGDVMDHTYRQAVTAAGTGCMAALDAERFLSGIEIDLHGHVEEAEAAE